ncbi:MAG: hypothetical protein GQ583_07200 [Methyloprofundus sp.]|nr:hypothetical protein [Methyloprofundus sp.]
MIKKIVVIIVVMFCSSSFSLAEEIFLTTGQKISRSQYIALVEILEINKADKFIVEDKYVGQYQKWVFKVSIIQNIVGKTKSVIYFEANERLRRIPSFHTYDIKIGQRYFVFLKEKNGKYALTGDSNQFIENADDHNVFVDFEEKKPKAMINHFNDRDYMLRIREYHKDISK